MIPDFTNFWGTQKLFPGIFFTSGGFTFWPTNCCQRWRNERRSCSSKRFCNIYVIGVNSQTVDFLSNSDFVAFSILVGFHFWRGIPLAGCEGEAAGAWANCSSRLMNEHSLAGHRSELPRRQHNLHMGSQGNLIWDYETAILCIDSSQLSVHVEGDCVLRS